MERLPIVDLQHECGPCTACCVHVPIPAGIVAPKAKPAGVTCPHLEEQGCARYDDRPDTCVRFHCAWLADGTWPEAWRPHEAGLLCLREMMPNGTTASVVYETVAGRLNSPVAERIIAELQSTSAAVVIVDAQDHPTTLPGRAAVARISRGAA